MPQHKPRARRGGIAPGSFAQIIRAYQQSPKFIGYAKNTKDLWSRQFRLAEAPDSLGGLSVEEIRPSLVQAFLDGLAETPAKQTAALSALKQLEKWARVRDLLPHDITTGCEALGVQGGHKPWSDAEVALAEAHARPEIAKVVTLAVNTGQRGSDLVRMCWSDFEDFRGRTGINVIQKKTKKRTWVPATPELLIAIERWPRHPGPILRKMTGDIFRSKQISNMWTRERDKNTALKGLKSRGLVIHGLRATAVGRLRRAGATTMQISDMIGMSVEMVEHYSRLLDQQESAIAAVYHLERTFSERKEQKADKSGR